MMGYRAVHAPGGNRLGDVRLDLNASFAAQDVWLQQVSRSSVRKSRLRTTLRRAAYRLEPTRVREAFVNAGIRRQWLLEFQDYWDNVIGGRPLTVMDFHNLRFAYRLRSQEQPLRWATAEDALANWQAPKRLYGTLNSVYQAALQPAREGRLLSRLLQPGWRMLEYGCGIAPMYTTWRRFLSHVPTQWVLADIPGFSFHYARHIFAADAEADFALINDLADPLQSVEGPFDLVIMQTVFEHLDHPRRICEYLLARLKPGGLFWFDYINTDPTGLNTPAGSAERLTTLQYLDEHVSIIHGNFEVSDRSLTTAIGRKTN
jgi:SAM-dependent methyltransferase